MSKANGFENDMLLLTFNATLSSHLGTLSGTGNANLYLSLHTADPTEAGNQQSSEASFTGYSRIEVVRTAGGWTVSGNTATLAAVAAFTEASSGPQTITHLGIGTLSTGTGQLLYKGALTAPRTVDSGITLQFNAGAITVTED